MLETLRGGLDGLRISLGMGHTLVQARTAMLMGGSTSDEFGRPSYDCRKFTSLGGLEHVRVLQTNLFVIEDAKLHRYTDHMTTTWKTASGTGSPGRDGRVMESKTCVLRVPRA